MSYDQDAGEFILNRIDSFHEALSPFRVLAAESLVDHERLQPRASTMGQNLRQRQPDSKIDPELLTATIVLIGSLACTVRNSDVEGIDQAVLAALARPLRLNSRAYRHQSDDRAAHWRNFRSPATPTR